MRLSAMGDVAMIVPVLRALVTQYPSAKITVVSRPFFEPFFKEIPNVCFFAFDAHKRHKGFLGLLRLFNDLKKLNVDAFADLHNVIRSKIIRFLFALLGKKVAYTDKGRTEKKALTRLENKIFQPVKTMLERHVSTFRKLGFSIDLNHPTFPVKAIISEELVQLTGEKRNLNWIGIAPFAQYEGKIYPLDLMQKVIEMLSENSSIKLFLFGGGEKEISLLNQMVKNNPNTIVVAGKINLNQELQLISNLDIMLSMDSGNAHIAAMLGVSVITLWGATHPFAGFAPFNQDQENCLTADRIQFPLLPTSVYGNKTIPGYKDAMRTILPEDIVKSIYTKLEKKQV